MASETLHEAATALGACTLDKHRALVSLGEELEAVDWYQQRADACSDPALRAILEHNRDEELEHASMILEWLRRHDAVFEKHLRRYLFHEGDIVGAEAAASGQATESPPAAIGIGPRHRQGGSTT